MMTNVLQQLAREEMLTPKQFEKPNEFEGKVGEGLHFLHENNHWGDKTSATGMTHVKEDVAVILEELLRQGGISRDRYQRIIVGTIYCDLLTLQFVTIY